MVAALTAPAITLLAGCFSPGPVPEDQYYRLAPAVPSRPLDAPLRELVVVERPEAAGIYGQRALVYTEDAGHLRLERYHYHHWVDTPPRLLQQELVAFLRAANVAAAVTAEAGRLRPDLRIAGSVRRFERQRAAGGWQAAVTLELRADPSGADHPLLLREYAVTAPARGDSMEATAQAFSDATAEVFRRFLADLGAALPK